jgi:hypothetical protein
MVALENVERHLFELGEVFLREQHLDGAHISRSVGAPEHKFGYELPLPSSCHCDQAADFRADRRPGSPIWRSNHAASNADRDRASRPEPA